jgi:hypothetical protein
VTRVALAGAIAAHGLIHLIGFVVPWQLAAVAGFPYRTTLAWVASARTSLVELTS